MWSQYIATQVHDFEKTHLGQMVSVKSYSRMVDRTNVVPLFRYMTCNNPCIGAAHPSRRCNPSASDGPYLPYYYELIQKLRIILTLRVLPP